MHVEDLITLRPFLVCLLQFLPSYNNMPKKGKKKAQATGDDPDVDIVSKIEMIYEDTKSITGVEP